jgi:uncharacterized protein YndB with AHSA1/START domain
MKAFEISKTFQSGIQTVFEAWSQLENLSKWWCPPEFSLQVKEFEFRKGGTFLYNIRSLDGWPLWGKFIYGEIIPHEKIEFINSFSDPDGNIVRAPFSDSWPLEVMNTVRFTGSEVLTLINFQSRPFQSSEEEELTFESNIHNLKTGLGGTLNQLNHFLNQ